MYNALFSAEMSDSKGGKWTSTFRLTAMAPVLLVEDISIEETDGNSDGVINKGEKYNVNTGKKYRNRKNK